VSADLSTKYLGLSLPHPIVVSACPLTESADDLRRLEDAGAAAAVFPSLFEEQIEHEEHEIFRLRATGAESSAEASGYFPDLDDYNVGPAEYLRRIEAGRKAVSMPLVGSLNGASRGGWTRYARSIEDAGAHALELNVHSVVVDPASSAADVERELVELVGDVCRTVRIPVAVKLGPHFTALPHLARQIVGAGAKGLVLFNRFVQPDIDLETLAIAPRLVLSTPFEMRLALMWIATLRDQTSASLGATGGAHSAEDVVKLLLAGADAVLVASVLYRRGPSALASLKQGLAEWLDAHEYRSVEQMKGSVSRERCANPEDYRRVNYMKTLVSFSAPLA
jgi:dihydroorotate dehydrogenase (fumarate)